MLLFSSSLIQAQAISPSGITNSGDIVNSGNIINSGKIGINQSIPNARLHISDDLQRLNCQPAILIHSNAGINSNAGRTGPESANTDCGTPYIFRNKLSDPNTGFSTTFNIDANGKTSIGDVFNLSAISTTHLSVQNNIGLYNSSQNLLRLGFDNVGANTAPILYWNHSEELPFQIGYGNNIYSVNPIVTVSPSEKVGINTEEPLAALHVKSDLTSPNSGDLGQIQGLLIENNGFRDHDFALEVRTGQAGATMGNGRVFTVSNGGTVHIGPNLNWAIPWSTSGAFKLYVEGGIRTERVKVDVANLNGWADYVFEEDYVLMPIEELEAFIKEHKHLPGVPSAKQVVEEGIDLAEMAKVLLEKIEELTLRVIEIEKSNNENSN